MKKIGTTSDGPPRPDHNYQRALALLEKKKEKLPSDFPTWTRVLVEQGRKGKIKDQNLAHALRIAERPAQRLILEAFLFSGEKNSEIAKVLTLSEEVVTIFSELFFDVEHAFPSKLERIDYIDALSVAATKEKDEILRARYQTEYELKQAAFTIGPIYLKRQFCPGALDGEDVDQMLQIATEDMFVRGLAHRLNPIQSEAAKNAQSWYTLLAKSAATLQALRKDHAPTAVDALLMELVTGPDEEDKRLEAPEGVTVDDLREGTEEENKEE